MGATTALNPSHVKGGVSIHAPVMGATHYDSDDDDAMASFNPRARDGRDQH